MRCDALRGLARRIGTLPEAGASRPTPWVYTDVLATIACDRLGINPAEAALATHQG